MSHDLFEASHRHLRHLTAEQRADFRQATTQYPLQCPKYTSDLVESKLRHYLGRLLMG